MRWKYIIGRLRPDDVSCVAVERFDFKITIRASLDGYNHCIVVGDQRRTVMSVQIPVAGELGILIDRYAPVNVVQRLRSDRHFCVTLNRSEAIDPAKVIKTIPYAHPVFTRGAVAAQARHGVISGVRRTHYCGAYWGWGFHEDGVVSALRALAPLGVRA